MIKNRIYTIIALLFLFNSYSHAEEISNLEDPTLKISKDKSYREFLTTEYIPFKNVFTELPKTGWSSLKTAFSKESLPYWGLILGSTAVLYQYDEDLLDSTQKTGRKWGLGNDDNTKAAFQIGPWDIRLPTDTGSTLYFLGDGITHLTIAGSFIGYGHYIASPRAWNTGMQLLHGLGISTFFSQVLKRSFGRESPYRSTEERGAWRPFPSFSEYNNNTSKYDAMPSGHIMTATLTFTIVIENYPEHAYWLRPLEVVWLSALGLQMMNNGVHWASDYPLGIAMGYLYAKASLGLGRTEKENPKPDELTWTIYPSYEEKNDVMLTNLLIQF